MRKENSLAPRVDIFLDQKSNNLLIFGGCSSLADHGFNDFIFEKEASIEKEPVLILVIPLTDNNAQLG